MSNEFKHAQTADGLNLQNSEWIGISTHIADGQTLGDELWFNGTVWGRRAGKTYRLNIQTATYTALATDDLIICNKSSAMTINLPAASGSGKKLVIKNINTGTVTVDGNSSDTIDGETTQSLYQWEGIQLIDYAANVWVVV